MKRVLLIVLVAIGFGASSQNFEKKFYDADDKPLMKKTAPTSG